MSIKRELTKGVFWIALAKYSGIIVALVITAILARNVSPEAFGTMAVATVIMAFLDILSDMGLGVAVIQFKDLTSKQIRSLFTLSIGISILLTLTLFLISKPIAYYYNDPALINVIRLLCVCTAVNSLNIIPNGLMLKNKRFKDIAIRTLSFQLLSGIGACLAALHGWGIYALVITPIISSIGIFCFNYYNFPLKQIWPIDIEVIRRVWSYSFYQLLFSIINYFSRNADKLIIGKFFSMKELGYYDKSYRLMQMPLQNITFVITPVLHPILSSLQDNSHELSAKNIALSRILSQISFPLGILLYFSAAPIIVIIFGNNWIPSVPVFEILAISVPFQVILSTSGSMFQAAGCTKHLFYCGAQSALCTVGAFIVAAIYFKTIISMAWAWDISLLVNFIFCYWFMNKKTFKSKINNYFKLFIPQLLNSAVVTGIIVTAIRIIVPLNPLIQLIYIFSITLGGTLLMGCLLQQYSIKDMFKSLITKL